MKRQSCVFLNFLETVQYFWDRGSIANSLLTLISSFKTSIIAAQTSGTQADILEWLTFVLYITLWYESPVAKNLNVAASCSLTLIALRKFVSFFSTNGAMALHNISKSSLDILVKFLNELEMGVSPELGFGLMSSLRKSSNKSLVP